MNKNIRLLLGASSFAALAMLGLQGCGSDSDTSTPKAGASGAGAPGAGAPGAGSGGASAGSAPTGGGGASAGAATGGSGGATAGSGGASAGSGGATGGSGGATASAGAGGGAAALTCTSNTPFQAMGETCTTYCNNYDTTCKANVTGGWTNDKYADKTACVTDCMNKFGYTGDDVQAAICCRAYHVKNAAMGGNDTEKNANKNTHCPHAAGKALCK